MVFKFNRNLLQATLWSICALLSSVKGQEIFTASANPFEDVMSTSDIPQFITITFDDAVTSLATELFRQLIDIRDSRGCGIKSTFYISGGNTECELVQGLRKGYHEIATHTLNHIGNPSLAEIQGAVDFLVDDCGVPTEEIRGFRAPFLSYSQDTLDRLNSLGFLYDSTIAATNYDEMDFGRNNIWPFTYDDNSTQMFECRDLCNNGNSLDPNPGLWEIPMHYMFNPDDSLNVPMDYTGDTATVLQNNFERRYNNNRSPLGIFLHPGWLQANGENFKNWIESILDAHDDVYFVTSYELIEWMRNPVPKDEYQPDCSGQIMDCLPPPGFCLHGSFDAQSCSCQCNVPFCLDANGACTQIAPNCAVTGPTASPVSQPPSTPVPTLTSNGSSCTAIPQNQLPNGSWATSDDQCATCATGNIWWPCNLNPPLCQCGTSSPTSPPTGLPTQLPTPVPTAPPTIPATLSPTALPTSPPTGSPTLPVTSPPTLQPTTPPTSPPTGPLAIAEWDETTAYWGGDEVVYEGEIVRAKWWSQGATPDRTSLWGPWEFTGTLVVRRRLRLRGA